MRRGGRYWKAGACLGMALLFCAGCAEELGPPRRETTRVTGVVREGGEPVGGGWIEFVPTDGAVGDMRSAPIGPDGRFTAERVAVGPSRVGLTGAPVRIPGWRRYFDPLTSSVRRRIPPGDATEVTIDLYEELARQAARSGGS